MREAGGCPEELAFPGTRFPAARPRGHGGSSSSRAGQSEVEGGSRLRTEFCCCLWELGDPETPLLQTAQMGRNSRQSDEVRLHSPGPRTWSALAPDNY